MFKCILQIRTVVHLHAKINSFLLSSKAATYVTFETSPSTLISQHYQPCNLHGCQPPTNKITVFIFHIQCVPILGRGYETGGYKCECKQGYEYPFEDLITYYDGQLTEAEFTNMVDNNETRYNMFKCRIAGAAGVDANAFVVLAALLCSIVLYLGQR